MSPFRIRSLAMNNNNTPIDSTPIDPHAAAGSNIFLSAVTSEFGELRSAVAKILRALGYSVREQKDFAQGPGTLIQALQTHIAQSDRVVLFVGQAFGYAAQLPAGCDQPLRSYTQWEYYFTSGVRIDENGQSLRLVPPKPYWLYFPGHSFPGQDHTTDTKPGAAPNVTATQDEVTNQAQFVQELKNSPKHRTEGGTDKLLDHVCVVLKDLTNHGWTQAQVLAQSLDPEVAQAFEQIRDALQKKSPDSAQYMKETQTYRAHQPRGPDEYFVHRVALRADPKNEIDREFTPLTVSVDRPRSSNKPGAQVEHGAQKGDESESEPELAAARPEQAKFNYLLDAIESVELQGKRGRVFQLQGEPGAGKSTLLGRLEFDLAVRSQTGLPGRQPIPFFVPMNGFRSEESENKSIPEPQAWLEARWRAQFPAMPSLAALRQARWPIWYLLDGLNEIPYLNPLDLQSRLNQWSDWLITQSEAGTDFRAVFSTRFADRQTLGRDQLPVTRVQINELDDLKVQEFLVARASDESGQKLPGHGEALWQQLSARPDVLAAMRNPFWLVKLLELVNLGESVPNDRAELLTHLIRRQLAHELGQSNPELLCSGLITENDLRSSRGELLEKHSDVHIRGYALPDDGPLFPELARLAFEGQRSSNDDFAQVSLAGRALRAVNAQMADACTSLRLLAPAPSGDRYNFTHQLLGEFFAARAVAGLSKTCAPLQDLVFVNQLAEVKPLEACEAAIRTAQQNDTSLPPAPNNRWTETLLLAAPMASDHDALFDVVRKDNPTLAACFLVGSGGHKPWPKTPSSLQYELFERSRSPKTDLRLRITAADALWALGHPEYEPVHRADGRLWYLKPPMVQIPAGTYWIGSDAGVPYDNEKPTHLVPLASFTIAKYPVTNAEWRLFMADRGYEQMEFWQGEASQAWLAGGSHDAQRRDWEEKHLPDIKSDPDRWIAFCKDRRQQPEPRLSMAMNEPEDIRRWLLEQFPDGERHREPSMWRDPLFNRPSQPVVGISWFEARAYCLWLSSRTGLAVGPPTEAQWEAAARNARMTWFNRWIRSVFPNTMPERSYPWGNQAQELTQRCNFVQTRLGSTSPVGVFPEGDTQQRGSMGSIADLAGNVWEWTDTRYSEHYQDKTVRHQLMPQAIDYNARCVLRGGSWYYNPRRLRAAIRDDYHPGGRGDGIGMRLVSVPHLDPLPSEPGLAAHRRNQ
jgi:formylglycine-generating enzyme required for sulfatase activity